MQSGLVELSERVANQGTLDFFCTLFGSIAMYIFSLYKGFQGTKPALRLLMPGKTEVFYDRADFCLTALTGSIVGTIFFHPKDPLQALSAGFGWVGALSVMTDKRG